MFSPRMGITRKIVAAVLAVSCAAPLGALRAAGDGAQWRGYTEQLKSSTKDTDLAHAWREKRAYPYLQKAYSLIAEKRADAAGQEFAKYYETDKKHAYFNWAYLQFLVNVGDNPKIIDVAGALIATSPSFAPAYFLRGLSNKALGRAEAAARDLEKARSLGGLSSGHNEFALRELVYLQSDGQQDAQALAGIRKLASTSELDDDLLLKNALLLQKSGKTNEAVTAWKQLAAQSKRDDLRVHAIKSLYFLAADVNDRDQTAAIASEVFAQYPSQHKSCDIALVGANTFAKIGRHARALQVLQAVDNNSESCKTRRALFLRTAATESLAARHRDLARRYIEQLVKLDLKRAERGDWLEQLGDLQYQAKDYKQALSSFQSAARNQHTSALSLKTAEVAWQLKDYTTVTSLLEDHAGDGKQSDAIAERLCTAYQEQDKLADALACVERLSSKHPGNVGYLKTAAFLAERNNNAAAKLKYLSMIYEKEPDSHKALDLGYLLRQQHDHETAAKWFEEAGKKPGNSQANMEYIFQLFASGKTDEAIAYVKSVQAQLEPEQQATAQSLVGYAEYNNKRYAQAIEAWGRAYTAVKDQRLLLNMLRAFNASGQHDYAVRLVKSVKLDTLTQQERVEWYKEAAFAMFSTKQIHNSVYLRSKLVEWEPTRDNWYSYAIALSAANQPKAATQALDEAIRIGGETPEVLEAKTYVATAAGADNEAIAAAEKALAGNPDNAQLQEDTAYMKLRTGDRAGAAGHLKRVIDLKYGQDPAATSAAEVPHYIDLTSQVRAIEQPLTARVSDTACFNETGCSSDHGISSERSGMGFGNVELDYQFAGGVPVDVYGRVFWNNRNDGFTPDQDSTAGALGVGVRPLAEHNLRISIEKQFKIGDAVKDNVLSRVAWSQTHKPGVNAKNDDRWDAGLYHHLYVEFAKLLQEDQDSQIFAEGRLGKVYRLGSASDWIPYGFARARHLSNQDDRSSLEMGVGVALTSAHLPHPYYGNRANANVFLEYGQDVVADPMDEEYRVLTGIHLTYQ